MKLQSKLRKMKTLKLQVGKTYRSREGKEVKIVGMGNKGWDYWEGSNGEWYYEGGKWSYVSKEHPNDLIEEVSEDSYTFNLVPQALTAIRYTFDIPNGMKKGTVSQEGNRIIVEIVPEEAEPKPGDVMINNRGSIYIFKRDIGYHRHESYAWLGKDGGIENLSFTGWCLSGRPATPEEAQPLFDALKKAGKRWNSETMQVEDVGPKPGDVMINAFGSVYIFKSVRDGGEHNHFACLEDSGNLRIADWCFRGRPATPEEAQPLFDALQKAGKRWNTETMQVEEIAERERIMDFLQRYGNNVTWNHEQLCLLIESYLKHREGKK